MRSESIFALSLVFGLIVALGFALIFWQLSSKPETSVSYSPFFLDQVEKDNIKSLSIQGGEARGELRKKELYPSSSMPNPSGALPLPMAPIAYLA